MFEKPDEIWMNGDFTNANALKLRKEILAVADLGDNVPVIININSYGGSVDALNNILDLLDSLPNPIITVCTGVAMSCGAVLLAYGDQRFMGPNSRVMIHQVSGGAMGTTNEVIASAEEMKKVNLQFMKVLAKKCKKSDKQMKAIFDKNVDKYLRPAEAKKFGIVDKIGTPRLKVLVLYAIE